VKNTRSAGLELLKERKSHGDATRKDATIQTTKVFALPIGIIPDCDQPALAARRTRERGGSIACRTESKSPGKSSSSSSRRNELLQTTPRGSIRMIPASRSTRKCRDAVDLLRSSSISQQFIWSCSEISLTMRSRVGSLNANKTFARVI
jgi:hypothetical protein